MPPMGRAGIVRVAMTQTRKGLTEEAIWLARVLVELRPEDAEALGLVALMLFCESRSAARRVEGRYVPLAEQDTALWNLPMVREAEDNYELPENSSNQGVSSWRRQSSRCAGAIAPDGRGFAPACVDPLWAIGTEGTHDWQSGGAGCSHGRGAWP